MPGGPPPRRVGPAQGGAGGRAGRPAPTAYYDLDWRGPAALVVGSEAHGLSPAARAAATVPAAIPMPGQAESLNAALAAGVVLFEALRQRAGEWR